MPVSGELPFPDHLDRKDDASFARVWKAQMPQIAIPFMGLPGLTVSTGLVGRVPVGVQVVSGRYREDLCLRRAKRSRRAACRHRRSIPWVKRHVWDLRFHRQLASPARTWP